MEERTYSTGEAAAMLDLSPAEVRGFARAGLEDPRRGERNEYRFGFRDLVVLRAAARLRRARVPAARIERALARLRGGHQTPLAGLSLEALGSHVVVRDGEVVWRADSDQLQLSLDPVDAAAAPPRADPGTQGARSPTHRGVAEERSGTGGTAEAAGLLERASALEEEDSGRALSLYARAAELDPSCWEALAGLGFLRQERGDLEGAVDAYERAQALGPDPTVGFNLGVALDGLGRPREAVEAYRAALALDPAHRDAHYNLSLLHERLGERSEALRHMIACRELSRGP